MEKLKHVLEARQFDRRFLEEELFPLADEMEKIVEKGGSNDLAGKRMYSIFYEASTRTRASFAAAIDMLGGRVVFSTENAGEFTKAIVGETLEDSIRVYNRYRPHVIVLRTKEEGMAKRAAAVSAVPIINAGDGKHEHPTQAQTDLRTIKKRRGKIDGTLIAICGDLARGRTVHSLCFFLGMFSGIVIYLVSPYILRLPDDIKDYLKKNNVKIFENRDLRAVAGKVNVIYQTRTQSERPDQTVDREALVRKYEKEDGFYIVNQEVTDLMSKDASVMHPLPRVKEITEEVDNDPRAVYLTDQIDSGLFVRMALLKMILG